MTASVVLLLVGDELLTGRTADANGAHLARRLFEEGFALAGARWVGDDPAAIARAARDAAAEADLVVLSGGLGPTEDDRTRAGLAEAIGAPLGEDAGALALVEAAMRARGREASPAQRRQALLPRGARAVPNPEGTAPGIEARLGAAVLLALPGVPREFRAMVESAVLPAARARGGAVPAAARSVWVAGRAEADVGAAVEDLMRAEEPRVGSYPAEGEIELRVVARGEGAAARAEEVAREIVRRLGDDAVGERPLAATVVDLLRARALRLTTAESVTGGLLAALITDVPGASDVFPGGVVAYSDAVKREALRVPAETLAREGAVSEAVVRAMAEGALARAGTDLALALTGAAGPDPAPGPRGPVPPGTVHAALARRGRETLHRRLTLSALPRGAVRRRAALAALDLLRRALAGGRG